MQGLEVHWAIQGRLVGRGRGNCLQSRRPAPLPTMLGFLSSSSCSRSGSGGGGMVDGAWCGGGVWWVVQCIPGAVVRKQPWGGEEIGRGPPPSLASP